MLRATAVLPHVRESFIEASTLMTPVSKHTAMEVNLVLCHVGPSDRFQLVTSGESSIARG